jgi:hypothetical protein
VAVDFPLSVIQEISLSHWRPKLLAPVAEKKWPLALEGFLDGN